MRMREIETAERFGILERCRAFEKDLLGIEDIVPDKSDDGVPFDLSGLYDDIFQVIIVPKYAIRPDRDDYWEARNRLKERVIALAEKYDLRRTEDLIEDHGEHFYFVFRCGKTWRAPGGKADRNSPICPDCQYCGDKHSFPGPNDLLEADPENPLLKHFYCCCGDCSLYEKDVTALGVQECGCFEEL